MGRWLILVAMAGKLLWTIVGLEIQGAAGEYALLCCFRRAEGNADGRFQTYCRAAFGDKIESLEPMAAWLA